MKVMFKINVILMNPISRVTQIQENEPHVAACSIVTYANIEIAFPILYPIFRRPFLRPIPLLTQSPKAIE